MVLFANTIKRCPDCKGSLKCIDREAYWYLCKSCDKAWNFSYDPPKVYYEGKRAINDV